MINYHLPFKTHPEVVVTELEGEKESVLLHLGTKKYYTLNETGVIIWKLLGGGYKSDEITRTICDEYEISTEAASNSVATLIQHLIDEKLLTQV